MVFSSIVEKLLNFFGLYKKDKQIKIEANLAEYEIIKINNARLESLEKKMLLLATGVEKLSQQIYAQKEQIKQDREFLVHVATLTEELLQVYEQNKLIVVKQDRQFFNEDGDDVDEFEDTNPRTSSSSSASSPSSSSSYVADRKRKTKADIN